MASPCCDGDDCNQQSAEDKSYLAIDEPCPIQRHIEPFLRGISKEFQNSKQQIFEVGKQKTLFLLFYYCCML